MKAQARALFQRSILLLAVDVVLMSAAGRAAAISTSFVPGCGTLPLCLISSIPKFFHVVLAGLGALLVLRILVASWVHFRGDTVVLPLATLTAVLFLGQVFLGAILVGSDFRTDLVVLHATTALALWVSSAGLALASRTRRTAEDPVPGLVGQRRWRDFLTLGKPWIVGLLLFTTLGGLVAGSGGLPQLSIAVWTLLGGAMAAAGSSALNQYIDRDLDKNMQRTARRPLPAGRLAPAEALAFGLALCLGSYYVVAGLVNFTAALLVLAGILYYVVLYSLFLKHATVQNIVVGGGAGAIPPMVGWAAATGHLGLPAWVMFLIIFMWTPPHFWALAIVRSKDYRNAGVPMLPVVKGETSTRRQILIYTVLLVGTTLVLPLIGAAGLAYTVAASLLGMALLGAAWRVWRYPGKKVSWMMYKWSSMYLVLIFGALVVDSLL